MGNGISTDFQRILTSVYFHLKYISDTLIYFKLHADINTMIEVHEYNTISPFTIQTFSTCGDDAENFLLPNTPTAGDKSM